MRVAVAFCFVLTLLLPNLAAAQALPVQQSATSQTELFGGIVYLRNCMRSCGEHAAKNHFDGAVCGKFCSCALTIDPSRTSEEMSADGQAARYARCNAEVWSSVESDKAKKN